ncbi:MAG: hypothetical protein HFI50_07470 [Lachnospiraceae bacterium]|jgi:tRNA(Arg) A34 adenosine deaminase TadA|nr:hypothetical protein [Lachnospiraceae bacterium]
MTVNEKMKLVINLAEEALEKNELPIACIIFLNDTIITQSHTSESKALFKRYIDIHKEGPLVEWVKTIVY